MMMVGVTVGLILGEAEAVANGLLAAVLPQPDSRPVVVTALTIKTPTRHRRMEMESSDILETRSYGLNT
jgi:hypothetical protein